jgi:hypothetical protein
MRQLASGHWQVQIRLKGRKAKYSLGTTAKWATEAEADGGSAFRNSEAPLRDSAQEMTIQKQARPVVSRPRVLRMLR